MDECAEGWSRDSFEEILKVELNKSSEPSALEPNHLVAAFESYQGECHRYGYGSLNFALEL